MDANGFHGFKKQKDQFLEEKSASRAIKLRIAWETHEKLMYGSEHPEEVLLSALCSYPLPMIFMKDHSQRQILGRQISCLTRYGNSYTGLHDLIA